MKLLIGWYEYEYCHVCLNNYSAHSRVILPLTKIYADELKYNKAPKGVTPHIHNLNNLKIHGRIIVLTIMPPFAPYVVIQGGEVMGGVNGSGKQ